MKMEKALQINIHFWVNMLFMTFQTSLVQVALFWKSEIV